MMMRSFLARRSGSFERIVPFLALAAVPVLVLGLTGCNGGGGGGNEPEPWSCEADAFEEDNFIATAKEQRIHAPPPLHTFAPNDPTADEDYIRFRVTELHTGADIWNDPGPLYRMWISGVVGSTRVDIRNSADVPQGTESATGVDAFMLNPGVYYMRVREATGSVGEYRPSIICLKDLLWTSPFPAVGAQPDIVVAEVTVPAAVTLGETVDVTVAVVNQGGGSVGGNIRLRVYVSAARTLGHPSETQVGMKDIPGLGYWTPVEETVTAIFAGAGIPTGAVYVIVRAEPVVESDVTNNVAFASTLLDVSAGDAHEDDDTPGEAKARPPIAPGGTVADLTFYPAGDVDVFVLDVPDTTFHHEIWTENLRGGADPAIEVIEATEAGAAIASAVGPAVEVTVLDADGNVDAGFTGDVMVAIGTNPGGGTLSGTATVAAAAGVATFSDLIIDAAGSGYTLAASAAGPAGIGSAAFDVAPGATGTRLVFTAQPSSAVAGSVIAPSVVVTVQDEFGATDAGFTGDVTVAVGVNPGGGTLSGTMTRPATLGVATFGDLSIDAAGTGYTLSASAVGPAGTGSDAFDVAPPGAGMRLVFTTQPSSAAAGSAVTPAVVVTAQDELGVTDAGFTGDVTVAVGTNPGGATLSGTMTVAAEAGVATFDELSMDAAGAGYTLTVSAAGPTGGGSAAFNVAAGSTARLVFTAEPTEPVARSAEDDGLENGASYVVVPANTLSSSIRYYVRVTNENGGTGGYDLRVIATDGAVPTYAPDVMEPDDLFEPESGIATWRQALPGATIQRTFSGDGSDVDYLVYGANVADAANTHKIETQNPVGCTTKLTLLNRTGGVHNTGTDRLDGTWMIEQTIAPGLYYIRIENPAATPGSYQVVVSTPWVP